MTDTDKLMRLACVLFAAKIVMLAILAINTRFVMDEFWQFGQAKYLWNGFYETIWPVKSVGYALWYSPAHAIGWDATSTLLAGRVWAFGTVLATLAVIGVLGRNLGYSWVATITVLVLLLSVSTYMERSFRLRSETPAILFAALSLWAVTRASGLPSLRSVFAAGVLTGCAFLCTQKAIYFNAALGLSIFVVCWSKAGLMHALRATLALIAGWSSAILAYCIVMAGSDTLAVLKHLFLGPAELATTGGTLYEGLEKFIYQTLLRNLPLYAVFMAGLLLTLITFRAQQANTLIAAIFTAAVTLLIFSHNQPWPYIFAMCLPFLALWSPVVWHLIVAPRSQRRNMACVVVALLVVMSFSRNVDYLDHSNAEQLDMIRSAESLLGAEDTYFDGIGILPNFADTPRRWLDAPAVARVNADPEPLLAALEEAPPDLMIETYRTDNLPIDVTEWRTNHYIDIAPGLWVPGVRVKAGETARLIVIDEAPFTLAGDDVAELVVRIDGDAVRLPVHLTPGTYNVFVDRNDAPVFIIRDGTRIPDKQIPRQPLFSKIYTH